MKPVMMDGLTSASDAYQACLASLLEVEIEEVPTFEGLAAAYEWNAWLASKLNLYIVTFDMGSIPTPPGMWLARIQSPYPAYGTHTVVMMAHELAHDPHPEPQEYDVLDSVAMIELMIPLDPAEPSGRYRLYG